jgi:demethylmenaquinone methyltransferase/2-methoxy-6-polyprenyl-1,4-benzoquinol methylase
MHDVLGASHASLAPHVPLRGYYADEGGKRSFVRSIFDETAADYDRVERAMALGSGSWYRGQALRRAGLGAGMKVLDVAVGTGLVARAAIALTGAAGNVVGVDPSQGMLAEAARNLSIHAIRATGEQLPLAENAFDFLSMGYALRHLSDLPIAFAEFYRVLRPGGLLCLLEITRPSGWVSMTLLKWYMRGVVPLISRLMSRRAQSPRLWQYYWDTIEACVAPPRVKAALEQAGFVDVARRVELGIFSEYTGRKPG